jgi:hypothetical protein
MDQLLCLSKALERLVARPQTQNPDQEMSCARVWILPAEAFANIRLAL